MTTINADDDRLIYIFILSLLYTLTVTVRLPAHPNKKRNSSFHSASVYIIFKEDKLHLGRQTTIRPMNDKLIIYQILTRLFTNNNKYCVPNGTIEQNGCGKMNDITSHVLESIRSLGSTHVWYTGIIEHATKRIHIRLNRLHAMPLCEGELAVVMLQHRNFFACHFCDGIKITILEHQIGCA